jgi:hypothetical protein
VTGARRRLSSVPPLYDQRFVKVKRPTIVVGGELTLPMLDLKYNPVGNSTRPRSR